MKVKVKEGIWGIMVMEKIKIKNKLYIFKRGINTRVDLQQSPNSAFL